MTRDVEPAAVPTARERVLDALSSITAERGLDEVTIREVAATAGVSIGTVQYYCRSKDEMLRVAFEHISERLLGRIAAIPTRGSVRSVLRRALLEFLPLDERRRTEARVYLAFAARAAVSPELARVQQNLLGELRRRCRDAFALAKERGEAPADLDPRRAGTAVTALIDGLLLHLLTDTTGISRRRALDALDDVLGLYLDGA